MKILIRLKMFCKTIAYAVNDKLPFLIYNQQIARKMTDMKKKTLPIGFDDFKRIISGNGYYIDKTEFIKTLLDNNSQTTLFTRPRRFGKTLNQSMIKYFFEDTGDEELNAENRALFNGLNI